MAKPGGKKADPLTKAVAAKIPDLTASDPPTRHLVKGETATGSPAGGQSGARAATRKGPLGLLQVLGPGLITGASDDDPSGIGTYSQVGSQFGYGLLWTAIFTFPMMASVQELCARVALHTGEGLGTSLRRKFPTWLVGIGILALFVANTINIGADLGAVASGGELLSRGHVRAVWLLVPVALLILGLQLFTSYSIIFRLFKYLTLVLFAYVVTVFLAHPDLMKVLLGTFVPHWELSSAFILGLVAVLGTTISPYLFFWQATSEVDEMKASGLKTVKQRRRVTKAQLAAARTDILVGMGFSQVVMYCIILSSAAVLNAHGKPNIATAQEAARALEPVAGPFAFVLFAVGMIGTGLLAVPILSGSAAYAVKEFLGLPGSLAIKVQYRPTFYAILALATLAGLGINFAHVDPIKALFGSAVINGLIAPFLLVLIVLLGSDRALMEDKRSRWLSLGLTWLATIVMALAAVALVGTLLFHRGG